MSGSSRSWPQTPSCRRSRTSDTLCWTPVAPWTEMVNRGPPGGRQPIRRSGHPMAGAGALPCRGCDLRGRSPHLPLAGPQFRGEPMTVNDRGLGYSGGGAVQALPHSTGPKLNSEAPAGPLAKRLKVPDPGGVAGHQLRCARRRIHWHHRPQRLGQEHPPQDPRSHLPARRGQGNHRGKGVTLPRAGCRFQPRADGEGEHLPERRHLWDWGC